ncbi:MAG: tRNA uridine-5-carboxymethylaminomethyl(34) synthesis enzyme MnmG [Acidobacteria bacterium]|nr:tRNA uridine-5-carboxymethylaminomethyl(34) synthesis enzyme MnmG [Acidobacteriota bacterium]
MYFHEVFDVVVIGGGHAGCEAALASAKMGMRAALYTLNLDAIGQMSCNPAVGGIAKGHVVRELDCLGGAMPEVIDRTGIQFRMLNRSRGPAVQAPRAQADRVLYRQEMRRRLEREPNLFLKQGEIVDFIVCGDRVVGLKVMDGRRIGARAVVLATGTFLNGLIHIGERKYTAGRSGEPASIHLTESFKRLGFPMGRLKTGTPPRIDGRTVDFSKFEIQWGDPKPTLFSYASRETVQPQLACYVGYTTPRLHQIIRQNIHRSPLYSGQIQGIGPRYCPSIEDKVVKFADKERHQIFLEPEGLGTREIYVNGLSTSMPIDVQLEMLRSIPGMENVDMIRPGYAIEYDFMQPTHLSAAFETKKIENLFHAGQINGTTGYEEAAGQGMIAGINAALKVRGEEPFFLDRSEAYTGIMIDDLVSKGVDEPYRLFTSRAEFRLLLRIDNADKRLMEKGFQLGLITRDRWEACQQKYRRIDAAADFLRRTVLKESSPYRRKWSDLAQGDVPAGISLEQLLKRPEFTVEQFHEILHHSGHRLSEEEEQIIETQIKYEGYIRQQMQEVEKMQAVQQRRIPPDFDYAHVPGLSREVVEKLSRLRPATLGMASRISGVTPAAVSILHVYLELERRRRAAAS